MFRNTKLGVLFLSEVTQWQVKRGVSTSDLAVFRGHFFQFHLQCLWLVCKSHLHGWDVSFMGSRPRDLNACTTSQILAQQPSVLNPCHTGPNGHRFHGQVTDGICWSSSMFVLCPVVVRRIRFMFGDARHVRQKVYSMVKTCNGQYLTHIFGGYPMFKIQHYIIFYD